MDRSSATMMRYSFENMGQLARHLHVVDNHGLLFLRDERKAGAAQRRVILELEVKELAQRTVVRGEVVARSEGQLPGAWLQFSDTRLARRLQKGQLASRDRRLSGEQLLQLTVASGSLIVQLLDIGGGGLRVRSFSGLSPGQACSVRVLGGRAEKTDLGDARVLRVDGQEAGLRFAVKNSPAVLRYLRTLEEAWDRAVRLEHPPDCCKLRGPIEPSLPKLRKQDMP
jgi:hypothetical protein